MRAPHARLRELSPFWNQGNCMLSMSGALRLLLLVFKYTHTKEGQAHHGSRGAHKHVCRDSVMWHKSGRVWRRRCDTACEEVRTLHIMIVASIMKCNLLSCRAGAGASRAAEEAGSDASALHQSLGDMSEVCVVLLYRR